MRRFADLFAALDATTSTSDKVELLAAYFGEVPPGDAAWAVYFLTGRRLKRFISGRLLAVWAMRRAGLQEWLFEESYSVVGDLAETVSLLVGAPDAAGDDLTLGAWMAERILPLRGAEPEVQRERVEAWWSAMPRHEVFILCKVLTGEFRVGVAATLVVRALGRAAGLQPAVVAGRLMGEWSPTAEFYSSVVSAEGGAPESRPYPFCLASPLEGDVSQLGEPGGWLAEWKWDGIRAQLIKRGGRVYLWSRGEELVTERFPEAVAAAARLPDGVVLDGELMAWRDGAPLAFSVLQKRIGRLRPGARVQAEAPVWFVAYDLLESGGTDIREAPMAERRRRLESLLRDAPARLTISEVVAAPTWEALAAARDASRARGVEGVMLKALDSPYGVGRRKGLWWKWKIAPHSMDAVLTYAQPGHGRRANLLTDYTFGVWDRPPAEGGKLVTIAKAYSGLSNDEIAELDRWIRQHTTERFGPVRAVEPVRVFEIAFENIAASSRHKAGIAVRFPRIARERKDKTPADADTMESVRRLLGEERKTELGF